MYLIRETVEYECDGTIDEAEELRDNAILVDARALDELFERVGDGQVDLDCHWTETVIEEVPSR